MGRKLHYIPGSFYRVDDRTGFPERAERTKQQWDNLYVKDDRWEPRQTQDFVKGTPDNQTVENARPITPPRFYGPIFVTMTTAAGIGAVDIYVDSLTGLTVGDKVSVMLDSGVQHFTHLTAISAAHITISDGLPTPAASGNVVCDLGVAA